MSEYDYDNAIFRLATAQEAEPEDYTGEDGLLYCGKCRQPKEAYFAEGKTETAMEHKPDYLRKSQAEREREEREEKEKNA